MDHGEEPAKDGWYPDGLIKRWHFYLADAPDRSICGRLYRAYTVRGVPTEVTRETVPFTARCLKCERILVAQLGITGRVYK